MVTPAGSFAWRRRKDRLMTAVIGLGAALTLVPVLWVLGYVAIQGAGAIGWDFFTQLPRPVGESGGGVLNAIVGSLLIDLTASLLGVVVGVGAGVFLSELREHPLAPVVRLVNDVMAGIPAIIMGLVAYEVVVVPMRRFSGLAGAVALGLIMIPIVTRATESVLRLVPAELREAGLALGLPRWRVVASVVLPTARFGVITGVLLALARVSGEAAPLLFTAFGNPFLNFDLLQPMDSLPLRLFTYAISPYEEWHRMAWASALVLVGIILLTTLAARRATRQRR